MKFKSQSSVGKVLLSYFLRHCTADVGIKEPDITINAQHYCGTLLTPLYSHQEKASWHTHMGCHGVVWQHLPHVHFFAHVKKELIFSLILLRTRKLFYSCYLFRGGIIYEQSNGTEDNDPGN
jgi:hypothetical protein